MLAEMVRLNMTSAVRSAEELHQTEFGQGVHLRIDMECTQVLVYLVDWCEAHDCLSCGMVSRGAVGRLLGLRIHVEQYENGGEC